MEVLNEIDKTVVLTMKIKETKWNKMKYFQILSSLLQNQIYSFKQTVDAINFYFDFGLDATKIFIRHFDKIGGNTLSSNKNVKSK
jgi:hypothetical protein